MEGEGQHIGRELLEEMKENGQSRIQLQFVSDVAKRDSDTTCKLFPPPNLSWYRLCIELYAIAYVENASVRRRHRFV